MRTTENNAPIPAANISNKKVKKKVLSERLTHNNPIFRHCPLFHLVVMQPPALVLRRS